VASSPTGRSERETHWDRVYSETDTDLRSWYQSEPTLSLQLLDALGVKPSAAVIDIGGGESNLVDCLLARSYVDVTVLDISPAALAASKRRVGVDHRVNWVNHDLLSWQIERRYDVWHDRAVFHFLSGDEIGLYSSLLDRALTPAGVAIVATFSLNGPEYCSGLPVNRYDAERLTSALGGRFELIDSKVETHVTPTGVEQPFTWAALRRS
jgi:cyclopropane fatty-acyl-phospholipid synthase-like methyltransferase